MEERIKIGRVHITPEKVESQVTGGGAHGPGRLARAVDYDDWRAVRFDKDYRSRSRRSGTVIWTLPGPGLYRLTGAAGGSTCGLSPVHFEVDDDGVRELPGSALDAALRARFPEGAARHDRAAAEAQRQREAQRRAADERQARARAVYEADPQSVAIVVEPDGTIMAEVAAPVDEAGACLDPAFPRAHVAFYTATGRLRRDQVAYENAPGALIARTRVGADEVLAIEALPGAEGAETLWYVITDGEAHRVSAADAEAVREAARRRIEGELPELKGTPKQVAWARDIRARLAARNPNDPRLRQAVRAKYWIERRAEF